MKRKRTWFVHPIFPTRINAKFVLQNMVFPPNQFIPGKTHGGKQILIEILGTTTEYFSFSYLFNQNICGNMGNLYHKTWFSNFIPTKPAQKNAWWKTDSQPLNISPFSLLREQFAEHFSMRNFNGNIVIIKQWIINEVLTFCSDLYPPRPPI